MLEQLKIKNFRRFKYFELNHLGRVNLLVGENNSGKTSILEAIQLFFSGGDLQLLKQIMIDRGEHLQHKDVINISHIFEKHKIVVYESTVLIEGDFNHFKKQLRLSVNKPVNIEGREELEKRISQATESNLIQIKNAISKEMKSLDKNITIYDLSPEGEIGSQLHFFIGDMPLNLIVDSNIQTLKTKFLSSSSLTSQESLELFNQVVLTPEEDLVYQALQIIEPNIERIAPIGYEIKNIHSRGGFFVRLKDTQKRIPIGSMGDGIWRMLGLSLALVSAKDGVLLVDEIDTGLHYTALEDMWKLIWETSKKLNVQVFATTHNSDCWKALSALTSREDVGEEDISIQRIEKDAPRSVVYNKEEIATAVERETEVR